MHHCVGGYIDTVRSGKRYIYRVRAPERATLEIWKNDAGGWEMRQLTTYSNSTPGNDVRRRVREWLDEKNNFKSLS